MNQSFGNFDFEVQFELTVYRILASHLFEVDTWIFQKSVKKMDVYRVEYADCQ